MLTVIGGNMGNNKSKEVFRNVMKRVFENELLAQYSWFGKKSQKDVPAKKAFMVYLNTINMIFLVVSYACSSYSEIENDNNFKNYLKTSVSYQLKKSCTANDSASASTST